ncbi:MAG: diguanylate cyclase, partial [Rhodospirillaceae bacterium]
MVVPVLAPVPIAWIVMAVEMDDAFAGELRRASTVPVEVSFAYRNEDGWLASASTLNLEQRQFVAAALDNDQRFMSEPGTLAMGASDYVTLVAPLLGPDGRSRVDIVLQYSLDVALQPYQPLFLLLLVLATAALALTLAAAVAIANGIAKPIRLLDTAARRIQGGRYDEKIAISQKDELGRLSETFNQMMEGIAEREERIAYQARHDSPTGLPNRMSFEGHVADIIATLQGSAGMFSVLLLQIDRFSEINNTLGHDTGEQLIKKIGKSLQEVIPGSNAVARHSNSMFAVALDKYDAAQVQQLVERILLLFENAVAIGGLNVDVTVTIGEARYPEHG